MFVRQGYFAASFEPNKPLNSGGVAVVKSSRSPQYKEGDVVTGLLPWVTIFVLDSEQQVSITLPLTA